MTKDEAQKRAYQIVNASIVADYMGERILESLLLSRIADALMEPRIPSDVVETLKLLGQKLESQNEPCRNCDLGDEHAECDCFDYMDLCKRADEALRAYLKRLGVV
jgi:sigma54-dependent transcription regulator